MGASLLPLFAIWLLEPGQVVNVPPRGAIDSPSPSITVKRTAPLRIVFVEHVGPYWTLGPVFRHLRDYLVEHDLPGPMFARYLSNPAAVAPDSLRTRVGFVIASDHVPLPPFRVGQRSRELVASMIVGPTSATPSRAFSELEQWANDHGYIAVGPLTETYLFPMGRSQAATTEIQLVIEPAVPSTIHEAEPLIVRPFDPVSQTRHAETFASAQATPARNDEPKTGREPTTPAEMVSGMSDIPDGTSPSTIDSSSRHVEPEPQPVRPLTQLVEEGRFELLAEQLLPAADAIPPELQLWLGQLVFRVGAAARGVEHVHPGSGARITVLSEALARRFRVVSSSFAQDPLADAVVRVDPQTDPRAMSKQTIIRDIDVILGRIAFGGIEGGVVLEELTVVLQRAQDLIRSEKPSGDRPDQGSRNSRHGK